MDDGWKRFIKELMEYMRVNDKELMDRIRELFRNDEDPVLLTIAFGHAYIAYNATNNIVDAYKTLKEYFTEC